MKKLIFIVLSSSLSIVIALPSFADYLVCDPQANVTKYRVVGLDPARNIVDAEPDGSVRYDVAGMAPGPYSGTLEAGWPYILDGVPQPAMKWSDAVPFDLIVPDTPAASSGKRVEQ